MAGAVISIYGNSKEEELYETELRGRLRAGIFMLA